jgi:hypothetical protein
MRFAVLAVALLFIAMLTALTVLDIVHYGVTALDVLSFLILALFLTGVLGALRNPPRE